MEGGVLVTPVSVFSSREFVKTPSPEKKEGEAGWHVDLDELDLAALDVRRREGKVDLVSAAAGAASARAKAEEAVRNGKRLERLTEEDIDDMIENQRRPRPVFPADYLPPYPHNEKSCRAFLAGTATIIGARQGLWDRQKEILDHYYVYGYTHIVLDDDDDED